MIPTFEVMPAWCQEVHSHEGVERCWSPQDTEEDAEGWVVIAGPFIYLKDEGQAFDSAEEAFEHAKRYASEERGIAVPWNGAVNSN